MNFSQPRIWSLTFSKKKKKNMESRLRVSRILLWSHPNREVTLVAPLYPFFLYPKKKKINDTHVGLTSCERFETLNARYNLLN